MAVKRLGEVYTAAFDVATWDLDCETVWEKICYIEYCTWAGKSIKGQKGIDLSVATISKKLSATMTEYSYYTICKNLSIARKSLEEKGVIRLTSNHGYRGTHKYWLNDTQRSRKLGRWSGKYSKSRPELYGMIGKEIVEEEIDLDDDLYEDDL